MSARKRRLVLFVLVPCRVVRVCTIDERVTNSTLIAPRPRLHSPPGTGHSRLASARYRSFFLPAKISNRPGSCPSNQWRISSSEPSLYGLQPQKVTLPPICTEPHCMTVPAQRKPAWHDPAVHAWQRPRWRMAPNETLATHGACRAKCSSWWRSAMSHCASLATSAAGENLRRLCAAPAPPLRRLDASEAHAHMHACNRS